MTEDSGEAEYFTLDYTHDKYANKALKFYAFICQEEYPELSKDIWLRLRDAAISKGEKDD